MRRRRWARAATTALASCLAIAVLLQLVAVAEGRSPPSLLPSPRRAHGDGHVRGHARPRTHSGSVLPPPSTAASAMTAVHHAVAAPAAASASVRFDAAAAAAGTAVRCKNGGGRKAASGAAAGVGACAGAEDDDDKRRIPTGPNPLHNR